MISLVLRREEKLKNMEKEENYRKQVYKTFFKNGMLLKLPQQNRKKDVVLQKISSKLLKDQLYSKEDLCEALRKIYPDAEKLMTELLASRFVKSNKGAYSLV